jgi:hypothetical protein
VNSTPIARFRRPAAAIVLAGGLTLAVLQAAARLAALGQPLIPPEMAASGGGIGSASIGGIDEDIVILLPAAAVATWCLASAPRRRRWWAPAYVAIVAVHLVGRVIATVYRGSALMRELQEHGPAALTRPRAIDGGDVAWILFDALMVASVFVAIWLRLQPAKSDSRPSLAAL